MRERYVVPAMLPNHVLPYKYVTPKWWCPENTDEAAFMSKLQVSLALKPSDNGKHYAPEAVIVDLVAGSVMSNTHTCSSGGMGRAHHPAGRN
jgi:hypothetical protein